MPLPSSATIADHPWPLNARTYDAEFIRMQMQATWANEGILPTAVLTGLIPGDYAVTTGGSGLNISVAGGRAVVLGDTRTTQGLYFAYSPSASTVAMAAAHSTNPRIDAVLLEVQDSDATGSNDRYVITSQQGNPSATATLANLNGAPGFAGGPTPRASALVLAYVLTPGGFTGPYVNATHILDRRNLAQPRQACSLTRSTNVANGLFNGTTTVVPLNTVERDNNRMADTANSRIVARVDGVYAISAQGNIGASSAGGRRHVAINVNGSLVARQLAAPLPSGGSNHTLQVSTLNGLAAGDTVEMTLFQDSGGALDIVAANTRLSVWRVA